MSNRLCELKLLATQDSGSVLLGQSPEFSPPDPRDLLLTLTVQAVNVAGLHGHIALSARSLTKPLYLTHWERNSFT